MLIQIMGAFLGIISVSVIYGIHRKFFMYCGLCGGIGWMIFLVLNRYVQEDAICIFWATLAVAWIAHIFARMLKAPVTLFLIPGILPLVPGIGMYRSVYNLIMVSNEMAGYYLTETLKAAGCIALAIFTMDTIFRLINHRWYQKWYVKITKNEKSERSE